MEGFWQSYKQGLGIGLGLLTVYLLAIILIGALVVRPALEKLPSPPQAVPQGGKTCFSSWV